MHTSIKHFAIIISCFLIWRIILQIIAYNSPSFLEYKPSFAGYELLRVYSDTPSYYSWSNFDGVHYLTIANNGYKAADLIQAFFPLYPVLIKIGLLSNIPILLTGFMISNLFFILLLYKWYSFFIQFYSKTIVVISILLLLIFPTSFFFTALYGESLFLLLVLLTFDFAHKKRWLFASICAGFASLTRIVGIFLVFSLFIEYIYQNKTELKYTVNFLLLFLKKHLKNLLIISLSFFGLFSYMYYLFIEFNDPLYFYTVQSKFGAGRESSIILLPQVVWRYIKIIFTANPQTLSYYSAVQEMVISILTLFALLIASLRQYKIRISWLVFSFGAYFLPTLTGTFSSMPRYVLVIFPLFLVLSQILQKNKYLLFLYSIISLSLLCINTILFIQGYWVA